MEWNHLQKLITNHTINHRLALNTGVPNLQFNFTKAHWTYYDPSAPQWSLIGLNQLNQLFFSLVAIRWDGFHAHKCVWKMRLSPIDSTSFIKVWISNFEWLKLINRISWLFTQWITLFHLQSTHNHKPNYSSKWFHLLESTSFKIYKFRANLLLTLIESGTLKLSESSFWVFVLEKVRVEDDRVQWSLWYP